MFLFSLPNQYKTITITTTYGKQLGDFIINDDGYYVFFPYLTQGYYNEHFLQTILSKLKELNKEWDEHLTDFFGEHHG